MSSCAHVVTQVSLPTQYNGQKQDPVGALSGALARLQANRGLRELREIAKGITKQLPEGFQEVHLETSACHCLWDKLQAAMSIWRLFPCVSTVFPTGGG